MSDSLQPQAPDVVINYPISHNQVSPASVVHRSSDGFAHLYLSYSYWNNMIPMGCYDCREHFVDTTFSSYGVVVDANATPDGAILCDPQIRRLECTRLFIRSHT